jgi:hypothetical protein
MRKLRSGIPTKVTDATGLGIHRLGQFLRANPLFVPNPFPVRPVLTEEAVKRAPMIEDGKVFITKFRTGAVCVIRIPRPYSTRADPISHTVGRKPIVIPTDIALSDRNAPELPFFLGPQTAITPAPLRDLATINTNLTDEAKTFTRRTVNQLE